MSILLRRCMREITANTLFYAGMYLTLISVALTAPLIRQGAPLLDVLAFLPDQLAIPATICLPLAFATGLLVTLGRMQEQGELVALRAAGISGSKVVLSGLPIALLLAAALGVLMHAILPDAYRRWREGKAGLARQAIAIKVARNEPIFQQDGLAIAAVSANEDELSQVFALRLQDDESYVAYAPRATWNAATTTGDEGLHLTMRELVFERHHLDQHERGASGFFSELAAEFSFEGDDFSGKADTKRTPALEQSIAGYQTVLEHLDEGMAAAVLALPEPAPLSARGRLQINHESALAAFIAEDASASTLETACAAGPTLDPARVPLTLRRVAESASTPAQRAALARLVAHHDCHGLAHDENARFALHVAWRLHNYATAPRQRARMIKELRNHELTWHLRFALPLGVIAYWLFASGLGLKQRHGGRMLAVLLAFGMIMLTLLPGFALVKGAGGTIPLHPALLLWPPFIGLGAIGAWLCWKRQ